MTRLSWLLFLLLGVLWGVPYLLIKVALRDFSPEAMILFRCVLAALALLPLACRERRFDLVKRHFFSLTCYTAVEVIVPWYLLARAEQHLTSSVAGLIIATVPLFGLSFAFVYHFESRVDPIRLLGLVVGFLGVASTIGLDVRGARALYVIEVVITAAGYGLGPILFRRYLAEIPSGTVITSSFAIASAVYLPFGLMNLPHHLAIDTAGSVVALGLVCSVAGFLLFFWLIHLVGPARATVVTYLNPIVAVLTGVVVLGEPFSRGLEVGLPLVAIGSVLATWGAAHEPEGKRPTKVPVPAER